MDTIELYEIDSDYIKYLSSFEQHLFRNKKVTQVFTRKYIGIVLKINGFDYFAPLSSFKEKHKRLCETKDFIKVGTFIISRKSGQKIQKIANLQYYKSKANYGTKKKGISR